MIDVRPASAFAATQLGWLKARHHFPVDGRDDPAHRPVKSLYVWNDDEFAPGHGFPPHFHRNVEIITYVRAGAVTHEDTLGNSYEIGAGDVQVMSAGSGLRHSEFNRGTVPLKLFQIWLAPNRLGEQPFYATRRFPDRERSGLTILASGLGEDISSGALRLRADARLLAGRLKAGHSMSYLLEVRRGIYVVPAAGMVSINGAQIGTGDGAAITGEATLEFEALEDAELVAVEVL